MANANLAIKVRTNIHTWKALNVRKQGAAVDSDPNATHFIIDLMADTTIEELSDDHLERVVRGSTAANLSALGYEGARSNAGNDITPFFTVILNRVKREFGDRAVRQDFTRFGYRGILNTTEIRAYYSEEVRRLVRKLLNQTA